MKQFAIAGALWLAAGLAAAGCAPKSDPLSTPVDPSALDALKTKPERTNFEQTSTYQEVVDFVNAVAKGAPEKVFVTTFGETNEKRALPLAVVGAPAASPEAVRGTGKIRVYIQGNIHGGEVEGKESAQVLLRELAQGKHDEWLKTMVFLIAPIYNADGNERFALNNRGRQHGPIGGQGQRPNAQGLDLNRDHMKLDSPEGRAVVKLMNDYDPHVSMDLHTTNGTRHAYFLTYAPPLNQATDAGIIDLLRRDWLPWVTRTIREKYNWDYYYYGNIGGGGRGGGAAPERAWRSFDSRPRFNNNYIGLRNRIAVLSEAFAYASFKDRILATSRFVEENLNFIRENGARIRRVIADAESKPIIGTQLGLRAQLARGEIVEILMGEVTQEKHPVDGHLMDLRKDVKIPERMPEYGTFEATETERVPATYYIPANLTAALEKLRAHGARTTTLTKPTRVNVEEFQISGNTTATRPFEQHNERTLAGTWTAAERELPAGTIQVDLKQPLGRLAFYLLEPRSDDGLVNWNVMDDVLGAAVKVFPIVRSRN
ncbi:MAG TPA: M14 family metallopeptidase [Vicinamibacterales bacterium]|nr:M14 family metallopeptidase [Vicinamibacterales bacterium]